MKRNISVILMLLFFSLAIASTASAAKANIDWKIGSLHIKDGEDEITYNLILSESSCTIFRSDGGIVIIAQDFSMATPDENIELRDEIFLPKKLVNEIERDIYMLVQKGDNPEELLSEGKPVFDQFLPYVKGSKILPEDIREGIRKRFGIK